MIVYVVFHRLLNHQFEVQGVFASLEAALAICVTALHTAVPFEVGRDYSEINEFMVHTRDRPEGVMTDSAPVLG